jgi:hypothetical protein
MKVDLVYWADRFGGRTDKLEIELKPFGYRMAPITQWKTLIADEEVRVERGKPVVIKTKTVEIPENTMVGPLNIMRHALGVMLDVVECGIPDKVEESKCISKVLFLPVDDGVVREGDLIGVLKVFFIRTGLFSRILSLSPPKVELTEEIVEANLTWRDDGDVHRGGFRIKVFGYTRSHIGEWRAIVASESVAVRAGEVVRVKIKEIDLPANTVVVPLNVTRNSLGSVIDVVQLGMPSKVEEEKKIHQAVFLPIEDGRIEEGDLLGVINVYYVGVKDLKKVRIERESEEVNLVYKEDSRILRKKVSIPPFGFKRGQVARWECLVSDEDKKMEYGKPTILKVKEIQIPKNTIPYPFSITRHAYGTFIDIYLERPKKVEEEFVANKVVFLPITDGVVRKGEILGILNLYSIEVAGIAKVKEWLDNWVDEVGKVFSYPDWPIG